MDRAVNHWDQDVAPQSETKYAEHTVDGVAAPQLHTESPFEANASPAVASPIDPFAGTTEIETTALDTAELGIEEAPPSAPAASEHDSTDAQAQLTQLRELLVGSELKGYADRMQATEDRLVAMVSGLQSELLAELSGLRHSIEPRLAAVERELAARSDDVAQAVAAAEGAVDDRVREMRIEFIGYRKTLEQTIGQVEERVAKSGRQLTQEITELRRQAAQEMVNMGTELTSRLDQIEGQAADRTALGKGLAELARSLTGGRDASGE